jgi:N-succinyldiaminopimelate aminotransferase
MNPDLKKTQPYPFERLAALKATVSPATPLPHIALSIGEPKHAPPSFVLEVLKESVAGYSAYPTTAGTDELRDTCARWLERRFGLGTNAVRRAQVLPVSGTREALFAFAQAAIGRSTAGSRGAPLVAMPNPFYQIYEGAALLAGAEPYFIETPAVKGFLPDLDAVPAEVWDRVQLLYLCSPGNPGGAVMSVKEWRRVLALAEKHDFIVASDECYTELYPDEANPPPSLLSAAVADGRAGFERCVVFHSLSKRSSLPGLRSGFVAGDARLLEAFLRYRTYHGCSMPIPAQAASIAAWNDEAHVIENRRLYREKFAKVMPLLAPHLDFTAPEGGFYLWADTRGDDEIFVRDLYAQENVTVVPGSYLARTVNGCNPGAGRLRISLVASVDECVEAAHRIARFAASR